MKFSENWLREWVNPALDTRALADRLTMAGLEVEAIEPAAPPFAGVVVGKVLEVLPHLHADRLRVCRVDAGAPAPLTIVCGAANVAAGMRAPVARVGATLPSGSTIARTALRGVDSEGMLCSAAELGLGEGGEGLLALDDDAPPGVDLRDYLGLDDVSIELSITPNRGDCLGIEGIAREVAALTESPLRVPTMAAIKASTKDSRSVTLHAPEACPRYIGRVIRDIDPGARTPQWLVERLRRSGLRSHGAVVDVTNYVLLELGQPMHAFDLERLRGSIQVRYASPGERLLLLDGQQIEMSADTLVIADDGGAIALGGIMGGSDSAIGAATRAIFLECAFFAPAAIAGRARRLGLQTDSSMRFERGVDPTLQARAMERATALILEIAGGVAGPVVEAVSESHLPARAPIRLRGRRVSGLLGIAVADAEIEGGLGRLGMRVKPASGAGEWSVTPPSFRFDIALEADLIEEIARVRGYDQVTIDRPRVALAIAERDRTRERIRRARHLLAGRGYQEAITFGFVAEDVQALFEPDAGSLRLANPISAETGVMRASLWPGLLQAVLHNIKRQQGRVRLFEHGVKFLLQDAVYEKDVIAGIAVGEAYDEQWGLPTRSVDFFDVKGDLEALLGSLGGPAAVRFVDARHPALHPGQSARVVGADGREIGWIGSLHPEIARKLDLGLPAVLFEILLDHLPEPRVPEFREPSRFPAVRRDLAIVVDESIAAGDILACVEDAAGGLLQGLTLFDIYQGKGVDSGKKSLALGLTFQDFSRTLTDTEIGVLVADVLNKLRDKFGATLRE
jgi:phenylalanyl-tRNA synthetase beta chain